MLSSGSAQTQAMWAPRFLVHPNTCVHPCTSATSEPVSCLTLTCGTQALYLATTCGRLLNWEYIHERSGSGNHVYETIWSLNKEETAYTEDVSRAARANVNSVWIMATLMKTCGKHYCGRPAPCDSPIRCRGSGVTAAVN